MLNSCQTTFNDNGFHVFTPVDRELPEKKQLFPVYQQSSSHMEEWKD
jgi:hypothetical protein